MKILSTIPAQRKTSPPDVDREEETLSMYAELAATIHRATNGPVLYIRHDHLAGVDKDIQAQYTYCPGGATAEVLLRPDLTAYEQLCAVRRAADELIDLLQPDGTFYAKPDLSVVGGAR